MTDTPPDSDQSQAQPAPEPQSEPGAGPIEVEAEPSRGAEGARVYEAPPPGGTATAPASNNSWAMACHLAGLIDFGVNIAFIGLIATLVVWLVKKDEDPEVDYHGKEAINFQISLLLWWLVSLVLVCCLIGIPMLAALPFAKIVLMIVAAVKAAAGERWRYPLTLRLLE